MRKYLESNKFLIVLAAGLLASSCSVEKNTSLSRFYHNLTSRYNIYFNAGEAYNNGVKRIKAAHNDDYSGLIPVFEYSNRDAARAGSADMDRAIQKTSKLISLHSMTAKPEMKNGGALSDKEKEFYDRRDYNEWIDDSYLLMGKAQLHKHELDKARVTFLHNIRETHDGEMRALSNIWLARTYTEMGNFSEANRLLGEIKPQTLSKAVRAEYYLSLADMHIRQNRYERAIEPLSAAMDNIPEKKERNRPAYILARLYEETGNNLQAGRYYKRVLKLNPPYEMEFNARISRAGVFDVESGNVDEIRKELNKLLRDAKNREYRDQIFFAHASLSMREGKQEEALEYYQMSAAASTTNNNQKGRAFLQLAEHYFEISDYHQAQMYYDSTVTFLDKDYPGYEAYYTRSANLNELIGYLDIVSTQDSLQYVASLSPSEIDNVIRGIIRKIEEEERMETGSSDDRYSLGQFYENQRRFRDNIDASGSWYFYNQPALTFGRTEFRNRWGDRNLEDYWRRRNKSSTGAVTNIMDPDREEAAESRDPATDIKSKEYYLKNLPTTDSLVKISDEMIAEALYNAANVYSEKINDIEKANQAYNSFIRRFPGHYRVPLALYRLFLLYKERDSQMANLYKEKLIENHPDDEYAKIVSDPAYLEAKTREEKRAEEVYNRAFSEWKKGNTAEVIDICTRATDTFPDSELLPKFMLLKAYAMAPGVSEKILKDELLKISTAYPGSDEAARASEMIAYLNEIMPELKEEEEIEIAVQLYDTLDTPPYRFMVILKDRDLDMNRLAFDVINYNIDNYTRENYNTRGDLVADRYIRISVGTFDDIETAMQYYKSFDHQDILSNTGQGEILKFIISSSNYDSFLDDRDADRYYLFFRENYLK